MMIKSKVTLIASLVATSFLTTAAAQDYQNTALEWVPANTIMAIGNTTSYGSDEIQLYLQQQQTLLNSLHDSLLPQFENHIAELPANSEDSKDLKTLVQSSIEIIKRYIEQTKDIDPEEYDGVNSAFYLDGLLPVYRLENAAPALVEATKTALADASVKKEMVNIANTELTKYTLEFDDLPNAYVLAQFDENNIVMLFNALTADSESSENDEYYVKRNIQEPVTDSLADGGKLGQLSSTFDLTGIDTGFIDFVEAYNTFFGNTDVSDPFISQIRSNTTLMRTEQPACFDFAEEALQHIPRFIFGTSEVTENSLETRFALQTSSEVASNIMDIPNDGIPYGQRKPELVDLGFNIRANTLVNKLGLMGQYIIANAPDECQLIDKSSIQEGVQGIQMIILMFPMLDQIKGMKLELTGLEYNEVTGEPSNMGLNLIANITESDSIIEYLKQMGSMPFDFPSGGEIIDIPINDIEPGSPFRQGKMARNDSTIALALGSNNLEEIVSAAMDDLSLDTSNPRLLSSYALNAKGYSDIVKPMLELDAKENEEISQAELDLMTFFIDDVYSNFSYVTQTIEAHEEGLVMDQKIEFNESSN